MHTHLHRALETTLFLQESVHVLLQAPPHDENISVGKVIPVQIVKLQAGITDNMMPLLVQSNRFFVPLQVSACRQHGQCNVEVKPVRSLTRVANRGDSHS